MLSKIKSPSLAESLTPHKLGDVGKQLLANISSQSESSDRASSNPHSDDGGEPKDDDDDDVEEELIDMNDEDREDLESQHTATDLVIDQKQASDHEGPRAALDEQPSRSERETSSNSEQAREASPENDSNNNLNNNNNLNARSPSQGQNINNNNNNNINNNNNNNLNINNNNNEQQQQQQQQQQQNSGKKTQIELLDIIETSRKRRLSKDSADSLSSFIRWSFSHFDGPSPLFGRRARLSPAAITRHQPTSRPGSEQSDIKEEEEEEEEEEDDHVRGSAEDDDDLEETKDLTIAERDEDADHEQGSDDETLDLAPNMRRQQQQHRRRRQVIAQQQQQQEQHRQQTMADSIKFATERVLRNRAAKLAGSSGPTAALSSQQEPHLNTRQAVSGATNLSAAMKRSRQAATQAYSPEPQAKVFSPATARNNGASTGNVIERLNQQRHGIKSLDHIANQLGGAANIRRQQQQQQQFARQAEEMLELDELDAEQPAGATGGLSHQLQQFLQQQQQQLQQQGLPLDELMLDQVDEILPAGQRQSSQQLALAAAIHRALLNGSGAAGAHQGRADELSPKHVNSSTSANSLNLSNHHHQQHPATNSSGAQQQQHQTGSSFLVDSLNRQQQQQQRPRNYNTRGLAQAAANLASNRLQQQQIAISNRVALMQQQQQQQRHAQAAAALSVLANGANPSALHHFAAAAAAAAAAGTGHQQLHTSGQHQAQHLSGAGPAVTSAAANNNSAFNSSQTHNAHMQSLHQRLNQQLGGHSATGAHLSGAAPPAAVSGGGVPNSLSSPVANGAASLAALANQTEFKCDTCPSSFDDRHRLMQHQSIHLELKKDWFTETPVEEVMKIFNRRRGEFLCNLCNLRFEATQDYDQHNHTVHGPRPYCCQFCGNGTRTFKCWRQYLNHLYDHRYIFSCTIGDCDFTVNRRDSLRFHIFRFHLNCQLPQNQQVTPTNGFSRGAQLSPYNLSQSGGGGGGALNSFDQDHFGANGAGGGTVGPLSFVNHHLQQQRLQKWQSGMMDDEEDTENEMNVAD